MALRTRHRRTIALAAAATLVLGGCAPAAQPAVGEGGIPNEVVIGATLPLSGEDARTGHFFREGYELAFDQANADGGLDLGGRKVPVRLDLLDDTSDPATAVNLAQALIDAHGSHALLSTYSSALVEAQSTVAEQNQIPYVNSAGAATSIHQRGYQWIFGVQAPIELLATTEMEWIQQQQDTGSLPNPARIALLWEDTSHGEDFRKGVSDWARASGGKYGIVLDQSFELDSRDFSPLLATVERSDADLFLVDAHLPDYITMQRQYLEQGLCHKVVTYGARGAEASAREALGDDGVENILSAVWWNEQLGDEGLNAEFIDAYRKKFPEGEVDWYQAIGYEATRALLTSIEQAGSVERQTVRDALGRLRMPSIVPGGTLSFPAETGYQARYPFVVQQNQGTNSPIIYPADVASANGVAPNPNCPG